MPKLLITEIGQLATPTGIAAKSGEEQGALRVMTDAWLMAEDSVIIDLGEGTPPAVGNDDTVISAKGQLVTPGLVDAHTHLVFGGWRENELTLKLKDVPYLDILKAGGGILSTVRMTREADEDALYDKALTILRRMLALGTTTVEAKSGYGLDMDTELKQLRVAKRLAQTQPVELVSTVMPAHALPPEYAGRREDYVRFVTDTLLPLVAAEGLAEFQDVFCEEGVFDAAETEQLLKAGQALGLKAKVHADEIHPIGGSQVAGKLRAVSAEHLIAAEDAGLAALKDGGVVACLLPLTSFYLHKPFARARDMMALGIPVAIGTDFNPGSCPSYNMQLAMNMACYQYKLTPAEVLTAATLNAAAAISRADVVGSLDKGKRANLVIWRARNLDELLYRFGDNMAQTVAVGGEVVAET